MLQPLHDRLIIKRKNPETSTSWGLVIPGASAEQSDQGEVVAIGPGKKNDQGEIIPICVKVGDKVLFGKYAGQTVKVDGEELIVMRDDDLISLIDG